MHKTANHEVAIVDELLGILIVEMHPDNHLLHTFPSYNISFPPLSPVTNLITPTNDGSVLMDFTFGISKLRLTSDVLKLSPLLSTLKCSALYSSVVINMDNYCIHLPYSVKL